MSSTTTIVVTYSSVIHGNSPHRRKKERQESELQHQNQLLSKQNHRVFFHILTLFRIFADIIIKTKST